MRRGTVVLLAGVLICGAQANILIDDFSTGFNGATTIANAFYTTPSAGSLGGFRTVEHTFFSNPLSRPISTDVNSVVPGNLFIEAGSGVNGMVTVSWGGSTTPASGTGSLGSNNYNGLGLDFSGLTGLQVDYLNNDQSSTLFRIAIIDQADSVAASSAVGVAAGNGSIFIPFGTIGNSVNLSNVKVLALNTFLPNGNDITLTNVEAVPEPATIAVLGLAAAAALRRKRK